MKSSNPGAEKMAIRLMASLPRLSTEIDVPAGMKTVAPACATLTEPPRCTRAVPVCKNRISSVYPRTIRRSPSSFSRMTGVVAFTCALGAVAAAQARRTQTSVIMGALRIRRLLANGKGYLHRRSEPQLRASASGPHSRIDTKAGWPTLCEKEKVPHDLEAGGAYSRPTAYICVAVVSSGESFDIVGKTSGSYPSRRIRRDMLTSQSEIEP
jgi:hypothetical protein